MARFVDGFSMLTHTHDFNNHSDDYGHSKTALMRWLYGHSKTALMWSLADSQKSHSSMGLNFNMVLHMFDGFLYPNFI
jgi:hypothetical protein